jgi:predicted phosphodiesterase
LKIGIVSDSHDDIPRLTAALEAAVAAGAETVLHCGDVVAAVTLARVPQLPVPLHVIHGNNTGDIYALGRWNSVGAGCSWSTTHATPGRLRPPATGTWSAAATITR